MRSAFYILRHWKICFQRVTMKVWQSRWKQNSVGLIDNCMCSNSPFYCVSDMVKIFPKICKISSYILSLCQAKVPWLSRGQEYSLRKRGGGTTSSRDDKPGWRIQILTMTETVKGSLNEDWLSYTRPCGTLIASHKLTKPLKRRLVNICGFVLCIHMSDSILLINPLPSSW